MSLRYKWFKLKYRLRKMLYLYVAPPISFLPCDTFVAALTDLLATPPRLTLVHALFIVLACLQPAIPRHADGAPIRSRAGHIG